ncbi:ribonuclease P protein component [Candidatus Woesebacteria bacterium RIFCSPHIGHO2_01_FULL_44_21]|uniref:Ribonuclease P protein component n=1 Tax=Candidatus Woesebacteria bacterium RIFCSPHIGHO2_01_FULL_44_21 TaxID=1802503 RepID=A0A1F7YX83_9BACT|nr:MAG: ribonuclease P protein component [Candidatus Woesebacteria bacterium RIFCSPHIGHO2_01_FULL_44_21]OGM69706.1 MAG: ribonuclease P protein component [Candidatus Woesebacteria bacterium RIFCSPLOWO2_01_FULL_44_24b]
MLYFSKWPPKELTNQAKPGEKEDWDLGLRWRPKVAVKCFKGDGPEDAEFFLSEMFSLDNRLKKDEDFKRVKAKGRVVQGSSFALALHYRGDSDPSRFGFVITKSAVKNASKRNMIKRALSESLRQNIAYVKDGYDGVFLVKPAGATKYMAELMLEVKLVAEKAKLFK